MAENKLHIVGSVFLLILIIGILIFNFWMYRNQSVVLKVLGFPTEDVPVEGFVTEVMRNFRMTPQTQIYRDRVQMTGIY